jgi:hypothetical protein
MTEYDLAHPDVRWHPPTPPPRDVEIVTPAHHCDRDCVHLAEAYQRDFAAGRMAERERREGSALLVALGLLCGGMVAMAARSLWVLWGGR